MMPSSGCCPAAITEKKNKKRSPPDSGTRGWNFSFPVLLTHLSALSILTTLQEVNNNSTYIHAPRPLYRQMPWSRMNVPNYEMYPLPASLLKSEALRRASIKRSSHSATS